MEKINIIHFVETLDIGGLENVVYNIVTGIDPTRFNVAVVCRTSGGSTANRIRNSGIPVEVLHKEKLNILELFRITQKLGRKKNSILHCHGLFALSSEAIMSIISGFQIILVHVHNLETPETLLQRLKLCLLKRCVNKFIPVSNMVQNALLQNFVSNTQTIHNGIDIDRFRFQSFPNKDLCGFSKDSFVLGMVGRIVKRKGFDHFIEIIANIPTISGLIVGSGPYEENVRNMISENKLGNRIKCIPFQPQGKLPDIYSSLDALFLFSEREGLPLSLLEAQSVGVPYFGNSAGGIGEVVKDGHNGFIIDKVDFLKIRDKINRIEENASYYRSNARKVVEEKYSLDKAIINIEKLYIESLAVH